MTSIVIDYVLIIGNIKSLYEVIDGKDPITKEKISNGARVLARAEIIFVPFTKGGKHVIKITDT